MPKKKPHEERKPEDYMEAADQLLVTGQSPGGSGDDQRPGFSRTHGPQRRACGA
jgi:hypothetical protein